MLFWLLIVISILLLVIVCDHLVLWQARRQIRNFEQAITDLCERVKDSKQRLVEFKGFDAQRKAVCMQSIKESHILLQMARLNLEVCDKRRSAWKSFAIALEALCDAVAEADIEGSIHAAQEVARCRLVLQAFGEYDA